MGWPTFCQAPSFRYPYIGGECANSFITTNFTLQRQAPLNAEYGSSPTINRYSKSSPLMYRAAVKCEKTILCSTDPQEKARKGGKGYPEPLIIFPSTAHTHSATLLHGRGSNATRFGLEFLSSKTSSGKSLQELFPSVKFIFPTAKRRRSTILKRSMIHQ